MTTPRLLRLTGFMFASLVLVLATLALRGSPGGGQIANDPNAENQFGVQGTHHVLRLSSTNPSKKLFVIDEVVVGADKIAVRYHAAGISGIAFEDVTKNPLYRTESPTLIRVVVDGKLLVPVDAHTEGSRGGSTRNGEFVVAWKGGVPHHIHVSVVRIEGDTNAAWELDSAL